MEYMITTLLIITVTVVGFFKWWERKCRLYWEKRGVQYCSGNLISALFELYKKPAHDLILEAHKKFGRIYGEFEFQKPVLTVSEPELLRDILIKDFPIFHKRRDFNSVDEILSKLVSLMNGDDWKRVRTVITPVFTSKKMRQMTHIINDVSNTVVEVLKKHSNEGKPVEFRSLFGAFTLDVIAKAAFATKIDSLNNPEHIFVENVKRVGASPSILRFVVLIILPKWLINLLGIGFLPSVEFFKKAILQVIKGRNETGKKYDDMLQLFLDAKDEHLKQKSKEVGNAEDQEDEIDQFGSVTNTEMSHRTKYKTMSENELIAQCILFLIVGYGTTASTLSFMAYYLALNPECQKKLIAEVDEVFEKQKELNYETIRAMKYLDCVVSETLRMYPAAIRSERCACEDYNLGNTGIKIEKGTLVGFNIYAMHHDPEFFSDPHKFHPERFLPENVSHPQYSYLPFGEGPRNCLGMRFALMEMKFVISHILRHYSLKISKKTKVPIEVQKFATLMDVDELFLDVERRNV